MRTFTNRVIGLVLALAMIAAFVLAPMPTDIKANAATVTSTNLVSNIQDGVTLQCWNWSIANIKANLGLIANSGYSAIQVSPMQEMKEGTVNKPVNNWWAVYQPISFYINESQSHCVGTKDELIDLCNEAHKYGIKVIMDVVFNHTANNGANKLCPMVDPDFLNDPACWHDYSQNSSSYNDRYDVTQRCMAGLPDLNTGNQKVQDKALALMKEYVDCGVDGFRFDAAKQIETPDDHSSYASDFWPTVVNGTTSYAQSTRGITPYYYGELLQDTDNYGSLPISAYTKYMSATESVWSNDIRYKMEEHNASALRTSYFKDAPADKLVLWAESHDTIGDLSSLYSSDYVRNKAWALAASRAYTMALYFPRSNYMTNIDPNAKDRIYQEMGELAKLGWSSEFTKAVNYFHNHFAGQSERLTQDTGANLYYNERGNSGVIITNFNDGGRDINLPVYAMASGTYYDQLTGNKFTVSNGRITGKMGDTGVAVVYNPSTKSCSHSSHGADGYCYSCFAYVGHKSGSTCSTCGTASTRTIYFMNNESWSTPYIYGWHDSAGEATASWPGTKMTLVEGSIWSATIPTTATNIIFNDGNGRQTVNLVPSASDDTYDNEFGTWSTRGEVIVADNYYLFYTTNSGAYNSYDYRFVDGKLTMTFAETSYIWLIDSNGVQYMTDGWLGVVTSATLKTLDSMTDVPNKMPVPAGIPLTFTMTHNTDGTITLSYAEASGGESGGNTGGNPGGNQGGTTTGKTIYFTNSSNWSKVNVYTWDASGTATNGAWPGSAMTKVSGNVYSYTVSGNAVSVIFNDGGSNQTSDLTIPTDSKNHYTGSSWTTYSAGSGDQGGSSSGGTVTGGSARDNTWYLFWGNSTGSLNHNEWDTCFTGGKVTVTFAENMYVWVITNVDGTQYMTEGWAGNVNSVKLYAQSQLTSPNKLLVPAGTHTLTLSENSDGSLTLAYGDGNSGNQGGNQGGNEGGSTGGDTGSTTTTTIYFDASSNGWTNVNVYTWDANETPYTGAWPGSAMTKVSGNVYSYNVPTGATKIIFNNGTSQTSDLTIPTDGKNLYNGSSWSVYGSSSGNEGGNQGGGSTGDDVTGGSARDNTWYLFWGNSTGSLNHNEWDTCFTGGKVTVTFAETMYVWVITNVDGTQYMTEGWAGNVNSVKLYAQPKLASPNKLLIPAGTHTLTLSENSDGSLTLAYGAGNSGNTGGESGGNQGGNEGGTTTSTNYYLVGYINGADYGCNADWENLGTYKFVDGKLTVTFTADSYVFLKTGDNNNWYMAQSYIGETSGKLYHTSTGAGEKMLIPGNVKVTMTLVENADGTLTLSYVTDTPVQPPVDASVKPTLTLKSPTLEFKDMITVNAFYTAENTQDVVEMGMITYSSKVTTVNIATAEHVIPGATYVESSGRYYSCSQGIHAKYLGDTVYLAIYAKLKDGTYAYSKLAGYSAVQYATSQLKNSTDTALKQLVVAMLNYGAEAQLYFGHNTTALANSSLTAEQKALAEAYRADMVKTVASPSTMKQGVFVNNSGFSSRKPAISFEGAFCINYFFTPKYAPESGITLYYWNASSYNRAGVLTVANATGSIKLEGSGTGEYRGDITGIAAKALSEAVYVAAVYENGGTSWTSGVLGYSIGSYCSSQASKGGDIAALAKATAVYGYHAKAYFG